ncbi:MAG: hypothetical protein KBT47_04235 [Armatimonadetes bacterium]|nr:hypothetical protein [Candidatus Hippobium faecium]
MTIKGKKYPVIGRISMQMTVVDISDDQGNIRVNDEAIIPAMRLPTDSHIPRIFI